MTFMLQGVGLEMPMGTALRLHIGILVALLIAYGCNPNKGATRALLGASLVVSLLAPLWLVGGLILTGELRGFYLYFLLSYLIPGLLATGTGLLLRQRFPDWRAPKLVPAVAVAYVAGLLISIPWSLTGGLLRP